MKRLGIADLPQWVQAVAWLGVPSVVALYLVYFLTNSVSAQVTNSANTSIANGLKLDAAALRTEQLGEQREKEMTDVRLLLKEQQRYLRLICANTSVTPETKALCLAD